MKNKPPGRLCKARGVSLDPDLQQVVDQELARLWPTVRGFSHYVQLLLRQHLKLSGCDEHFDFLKPPSKLTKHCAKQLKQFAGQLVQNFVSNQRTDKLHEVMI